MYVVDYMSGSSMIHAYVSVSDYRHLKDDERNGMITILTRRELRFWDPDAFEIKALISWFRQLRLSFYYRAAIIAEKEDGRMKDVMTDSRQVTEELYEKVKQGQTRPEDLSLRQILELIQIADQELKEKAALYEEKERTIAEEKLEQHSRKQFQKQ